MEFFSPTKFTFSPTFLPFSPGGISFLPGGVKGYEPVHASVLREVEFTRFLSLSEFFRTFSDMSNAFDLFGMPWFGDMHPRILFCAELNYASNISIGMLWFGDMHQCILFCAN